MSTPGSAWLGAGAGLSLAAALLHVAAIFGGAEWYRTLGAGDRIARWVARGDVYPVFLTCGIAAILLIWSAYAASGAALIPRFPLLRTALVAITIVYLARGMVLFWPGLLHRPDLSPEFLRWSSVIVLSMGLIHLIGLMKAWSVLGPIRG